MLTESGGVTLKIDPFHCS